VLNEWFAAAAALGAAVQAQFATVSATEPEFGAKVLKARNSWISIVRTVLAVLDHTSVPANQVAAIRNPIDVLEAKATARATRVQPVQPSTPDAPAGPPV
jgi:hypothetical protein